MKIFTITAILILTGCASQKKYDFKPLPPEPLIKKNMAEKMPEVLPENLEKGPFPVG